MTNLEHILTDESLADFRKEIIILGLRNCVGIEKKTGRIVPCADLRKPTGCPECLFDASDAGCSNDMMKWLNEEYQEPLPFPINTVLVAKNWRGQSHVFYYKGRDEHGCHCGSAFYENDEGVFTFDIATARKVVE